MFHLVLSSVSRCKTLMWEKAYQVGDNTIYKQFTLFRKAVK